MLMHPAQTFPTRTLWMAATAGAAALALWLFVPAGGGPALPGAGDAELPPALRVDGSVGSTSTDGSVIELRIPLTVRGDDAIRLTEDGQVHAMTYMAETASAAVPATYDLTWTDGNGDEFLDPGEHALLTVTLPHGSLVSAENAAKIVIRPVDGPALTIEDVLP